MNIIHCRQFIVTVCILWRILTGGHIRHGTFRNSIADTAFYVIYHNPICLIVSKPSSAGFLEDLLPGRFKRAACPVIARSVWQYHTSALCSICEVASAWTEIERDCVNEIKSCGVPTVMNSYWSVFMQCFQWFQKLSYPLFFVRNKGFAAGIWSVERH